MKLVGTATILGVFACISVAYIAKSTVPDSTLSLPFDDVVNTNAFTPQGWGFFTRDARENQVTLWAPGDDESWQRTGFGVNASADNWFGAGRASRAEGKRAQSVGAELAERETVPVDCGTDYDTMARAVSACAASVSPVQMDRAGVPGWNLCGRVAIVSQEPQPWAWAAAGTRELMPFQLSVTEVRCGE